MLEEHEHSPTPRATLKALPTPHHPPSPLQYIRVVILPVHTASLPPSLPAPSNKDTTRCNQFSTAFIFRLTPPFVAGCCYPFTQCSSLFSKHSLDLMAAFLKYYNQVSICIAEFVMQCW